MEGLYSVLETLLISMDTYFASFRNKLDSTFDRDRIVLISRRNVLSSLSFPSAVQLQMQNNFSAWANRDDQNEQGKDEDRESDEDDDDNNDRDYTGRQGPCPNIMIY